MVAVMVTLGLGLALGLQALSEWLANRAPKLLAALGALALALEIGALVSLLASPYVGEIHQGLRVARGGGAALLGFVALMQRLRRGRPWWLALLAPPAQIGLAILALAVSTLARDHQVVAVYQGAPEIAQSYTEAHDGFSKAFAGGVIAVMLLGSLLPPPRRTGAVRTGDAPAV